MRLPCCIKFIDHNTFLILPFLKPNLVIALLMLGGVYERLAFGYIKGVGGE